MMTTLPPHEKVKFWQAQDIGQLDLLHATYITHAFSRHIHNGYAIGVIEKGAETFYYRGKTYVAPAGHIVVINPGEVHTGQALTDAGWTYRMLYPEVDLVQQAAQEVSGRWRNFPNFPQPVIQDDALVPVIRNLHLTLEQSSSALERETHFVSALVQLIARHADGKPRLLPVSKAHKGVLRAQEYLRVHYPENISLEQLANIAELSPFHFTRVFRQMVGLPPHTYLTQIRIEQAKTLLTQGYPIVQTALDTGFTDQSHLTKRFKSIVGVTPGQYQIK